VDKHLSRRAFLGAGGCALAAGGIGALADEPDPTGRIDAHVHVWTPDTDRYPLGPGYKKARMRPPSFTPEQLFEHTRPCCVSRIVLIQMSFYKFDNSYMLDMMRKYPGVFSGVAVIDREAKPREKMIELAGQGVRGFRLYPGKASPDKWLDDPSMTAMWKCGAERRLAMCLLINPEYLPSVDAMCGRFPDTPVVVDHFARIGIDGQIHKADVDNLCRLARHKNVCVKTSAFYALGKKKAPYTDLGPMIRRLLDAFGPERLMWASDNPFQVVKGHNYRDSIDLIARRLDFLTPADRRWILRKTAQRMFFD
jgi:predicted TIM-barrel fold metal-dependent hydrolase